MDFDRLRNIYSERSVARRWPILDGCGSELRIKPPIHFSATRVVSSRGVQPHFVVDVVVSHAWSYAWSDLLLSLKCFSNSIVTVVDEDADPASLGGGGEVTGGEAAGGDGSGGVVGGHHRSNDVYVWLDVLSVNQWNTEALP